MTDTKIVSELFFVMSVKLKRSKVVMGVLFSLHEGPHLKYSNVLEFMISIFAENLLMRKPVGTGQEP